MIGASFLAHLLERAEADARGRDAYTVAELAHWPSAEVGAAWRQGFLVPAQPSAWIACPACFEGHAEEVDWSEYPPGSGRRRATIDCPEYGVVALDPTALQRWRFSMDALARLLAGGLGGGLTAPLAKAVVPDRVWALGSLSVQDEARLVLLGRGLAWPDGERLAQSVAHIVRAPMLWIYLATDGLASDLPAAVVALDLLEWHEGRGYACSPGLTERLTHLAGLDAADPRRSTAAKARAGCDCPMDEWPESRVRAFCAEVRARGGRPTIRQLMTEAGCGKGTVYRHFDDHLRMTWGVLKRPAPPDPAA